MFNKQLFGTLSLGLGYLGCLVHVHSIIFCYCLAFGYTCNISLMVFFLIVNLVYIILPETSDSLFCFFTGT